MEATVQGDSPTIQAAETNISSQSGGYCCEIKSRSILVTMTFFGFVSALATRASFNITFVAMVNFTAHDETNVSDKCPSAAITNSSRPVDQMGEFLWDSEVQSLMLGAFFYGYIILQLPGGYLAQRVGAKYVFGLAVFVPGLLSLAAPTLARWDWRLLVTCRFLMGLAQGPLFPANYALWSQWAPPLERSRMISFSTAGTPCGYMVSLFLSGFMCSSSFLGGWPLPFYVFGLLNCVWFVCWVFVAYDTPRKHPRISQSELHYIETQTCNAPDITYPPPPWKSFLLSRAVWGLAIYCIMDGMSFYVVTSEFPIYLKQVLQFDMAQNGAIMALPAICAMLMCFCTGPVVDFILKKQWMSTTAARKLATAIGEGGMGLCIMAIGFVDCNRIAAVALVAVGTGLQSITVGGVTVSTLDFAPAYSGILMGIANPLGNLGGFLSPLFVTWLTGGQAGRHQWQQVFFCTAGVYGLAIMGFVLLGTSELQPWARPKSSIETDVLINDDNSQDEEEDDRRVTRPKRV